MGPVPATAVMRRRLEPTDSSATILTGPMSPRRRTWVPPHSSMECGAGLEDADDVAVLVAEEGDGALVASLVHGGLVVAGLGVGEDLGVGEVLDGRDLLGGQRLEVAEVEPEAVGLDERALLLHVVAEHLAQRPVQDVGAGVVPADGVAAVGVDGGDRFGADVDGALGDAGDVAMEAGQGVDRVEHLGPTGVGADLAGVADLAAGLGVERCVLQEDRHGVVVTGTRRRPRCVVVESSSRPTKSVGPDVLRISRKASTSSPMATVPLLDAALARAR